MICDTYTVFSIRTDVQLKKKKIEAESQFVIGIKQPPVYL